MFDGRVDPNPINTIQKMLFNAKIDDISVYFDGDKPIAPVDNDCLYPDGTVKVPDGKQIMLYDDTEMRIEALGPQEVYYALLEWLIIDPDLNCTQEQHDQVIDFFKSFHIKMAD